MADLYKMEKALGISFKDCSLLEQSLVHSSYINENPSVVAGSNERLEFLGDAVLGLIITEKLYREFPELAEGEMTRLRAALVCRETLHLIAKSIDLGKYLYMGKGEETSGGRCKPANQACALEAVIGAIFLDRGLRQTKSFVMRLFAAEFKKVTERSAITDYKSKLQECIQAKYQITPSYHMIEMMGPEHSKQFIIEVRVGNTVLGKGTGTSKKAAEVEAARLALDQLSI